MIVSSRPGPAETQPDSAKILVFKPRPPRQRQVPAVTIESGSGWYHEAAIKEAEPLPGRQQ